MIKQLLIVIKQKLLYIRDLPKSIYVNFRCLPIHQAKKMPIRIKWNTKIGLLDKGSIYIECTDIKREMIKFGYRGGQFVSENHSYFSISNGGKITFYGTAIFAEGFNISIQGGSLILGDNFYSNRNLMIENVKEILIGDNVLVGWNVVLRDTDGHPVYVGGDKKKYVGKIHIGDHVWIASDSTILKNSCISDNSIVACESLVCGLKLENSNCLIAGSPAIIKRTNVEWEY